MTMVIELKEWLKAIYAKADMVILPMLRFVTAFCVFTYLNHQLGYMELLNETYVILVLSLLCAILPSQAISVIGIVFVIAHCFALHFVVAGCAAVILVLILLIGLHFSSRQAVALFLTPLACFLNIPAIVPVCLGLVGDIFSSFVAAGGVVLWYLLSLISGHVAELAGGEKVEILDLAEAVFQGIGQNEGMILSVIAVMTTVILIAFVRRLHVDYAWQLSVAFGGICYAFVMLAGSLLMDLEINILVLLAGTIGAMLIGFVLQFFIFGADYKETEYLQYEDDDFVYFVKAVPKYKSSGSSRPSQTVEPARKSAVTDAVSKSEPDQPPVFERKEEPDINFQNRLEESLKEL